MGSRGKASSIPESRLSFEDLPSTIGKSKRKQLRRNLRFPLYLQFGYQASVPSSQYHPCPEPSLYSKRTIFVDVKEHPSDRKIRSTLLHEMCHAAAGERAKVLVHGYKFRAQIEKLRRQKVPITIDCPETGGLKILAGVVPKRFPLSRAMMEKAEKRGAKLERSFRAHPEMPVETIGRGDILNHFHDVATIDGLTWREALRAAGSEYGIIDVEGKATSQWAASVIAKARKAYRRWRRDFLEYKMASAMVNCWEGDQAPLLELYRKLGKAKAKALQTRIEAQWNAVRATLARAPESEAPTGKNCAE
jgi:hypothetical protein